MVSAHRPVARALASRPPAAHTAGSVSPADTACPGRRWLRQLRFNVTYIGANRRAANLGCFRDAGLYRRPAHDAVVVHYVKGAAGHGYLWGVLHDGRAHDPLRCARAASIEIPPGFVTAETEQQIRAGNVSIEYDAPRSTFSLRFHPRDDSSRMRRP